MSCHQEGYDRGYDDAVNGKSELTGSGMSYGFLSALIDDKDQIEWENGYREGYTAGKEKA